MIIKSSFSCFKEKHIRAQMQGYVLGKNRWPETHRYEEWKAPVQGPLLIVRSVNPKPRQTRQQVQLEFGKTLVTLKSLFENFLYWYRLLTQSSGLNDLWNLQSYNHAANWLDLTSLFFAFIWETLQALHIE